MNPISNRRRDLFAYELGALCADARRLLRLKVLENSVMLDAPGSPGLGDLESMLDAIFKKLLPLINASIADPPGTKGGVLRLSHDHGLVSLREFFGSESASPQWRQIIRQYETLTDDAGELSLIEFKSRLAALHQEVDALSPEIFATAVQEGLALTCTRQRSLFRLALQLRILTHEWLNTVDPEQVDMKEYYYHHILPQIQQIQHDLEECRTQMPEVEWPDFHDPEARGFDVACENLHCDIRQQLIDFASDDEVVVQTDSLQSCSKQTKEMMFSKFKLQACEHQDGKSWKVIRNPEDKAERIEIKLRESLYNLFMVLLSFGVEGTNKSSLLQTLDISDSALSTRKSKLNRKIKAIGLVIPPGRYVVEQKDGKAGQ